MIEPVALVDLLKLEMESVWGDQLEGDAVAVDERVWDD